MSCPQTVRGTSAGWTSRLHAAGYQAFNGKGRPLAIALLLMKDRTKGPSSIVALRRRRGKRPLSQRETRQDRGKRDRGQSAYMQPEAATLLCTPVVGWEIRDDLPVEWLPNVPCPERSVDPELPFKGDRTNGREGARKRALAACGACATADRSFDGARSASRYALEDFLGTSWSTALKSRRRGLRTDMLVVRRVPCTST